MEPAKSKAIAIFARWLVDRGYGTITLDLPGWKVQPSAEETFLFMSRDKLGTTYIVIGGEVEAIPRHQALKLVIS